MHIDSGSVVQAASLQGSGLYGPDDNDNRSAALLIANQDRWISGPDRPARLTAPPGGVIRNPLVPSLDAERRRER